MLGTPIRYDYTGAVQTYTVPEGISGLKVDCVGASGLWGGRNPVGHGGRVQCDLTVTQGQVLYIYVASTSNIYQITETEEYCIYNASDIRTICGSEGSFYDVNHTSMDEDLSLLSRLVVAGGGGGDGRGGTGGDGGGLIGEDAGVSGVYDGKGGTQVSPGAEPTHGKAGIFGGGIIYNINSTTHGTGGAGWYGGSAGGNSSVQNVKGGGGGSSYTDSTLCSNVVHTQGYTETSDNGWIIITPILPDIYERNSSKDKNINLHSSTINSFIAAGYDTNGTKNGVYLKDLYPTQQYNVTDYNYTLTGRDLTLETYIGSGGDIVVPEIVEEITNWTLNLIKTDGSNGTTVYAHSDESVPYPTCYDVIQECPMSTGAGSATVNISGYPCVYLTAPGSADFGFENIVCENCTYESLGGNLPGGVVKITPTSNNATFTFSFD